MGSKFYLRLAMVFVAISMFSFIAVAQTTINVKIVDAGDDLEERLLGAGDPIGSVDGTSSDLEIGCETAGEPQLIGLIFRAVAIPKGATITKAYVQFQCDETDAQVITVTILGGKEANVVAPFPNTDYCISSHPKTTAKVDWSPPAWATAGERGVDQQTPDIKAVVQEIVNQAGWASGNNMLIMISSADVIKQHRTAEAFEGDPLGVAELVVTFTASTGINPIDEASSGLIYPNPTRGQVTISNPSNGTFGYAIYSITGSLVAQRSDLSGLTTEVDMSRSPKGTYIVEVRSAARTEKFNLILQ